MISIDISGSEGNAFSILGLVGSLGRQLDMSADDITDIQNEMTRSDYDHLLDTFLKYFGEFVQFENREQNI